MPVANHVQQQLTIYSTNFACHERFDKIMSNENPELVLFPALKDTREHYTEVLGAKWVVFEDHEVPIRAAHGMMESTANLYSAWGVIEGFIEELSSQLADVDPEVVITTFYYDEGFNFAGASKIYDGDTMEIKEHTYEELIELGLLLPEELEEGEEFDPKSVRYEADWEKMYDYFDR